MTNDSRRLGDPRPRGHARLGFWFAVTMTILLPAAPLSAHDLWPLVKLADGAVWGTLVEVRDGYEDRLLVIAVRQEGGGGDAGGPATVALLSRAGRLPECQHLHPGDTGLFLRCPTRDGGEFPLADASFVAHGFLALDPGADERRHIDALLEAYRIRGRDSGDARGDAFALLRSPNADCRRVAVGWLVECGADLASEHTTTVADAFSGETNPRVQEAYLRLFLLHRWDIAGGGASRLLVTGDDEAVADAATWYLGTYADAADKATLLEAYPHVPARRRPALLEAYARLQMVEALPWWQEALLSEEPSVATAAVEKLAASGLANVEATYEVLLASRDESLRALALRGLGTVATPRAISRLRDLAAGEPDDAVTRLAAEILAHPFRHGRVPQRVSEERP